MIKKQQQPKLGISEQKKEYGSCENIDKYNSLHSLLECSKLSDRWNKNYNTVQCGFQYM